MPVITLFDKSFLQSLNPDQALFFDKFFLCVVCPIFHAETLADLEKAVRAGRTPEEEVGFIANKIPELSIALCPSHQQMCVSSLLGSDPPMDGRVPRARGKHVTVAGQKGIIYRKSPEEEAYDRWMQRDFLDLERRFAKVWRDGIKTDVSGIAKALELLGIDFKRIKTLQDAKNAAETFVSSTDRPMDRFNICRIILGLPSRLEDEMYKRWKDEGFPPLPQYAPYAAFAFVGGVFFHIAVAAKLLNRDDQMDIAYLYYLPFCHIFVSSDNLHRRVVPLFKREEQEFVWGPYLRANLQGIVEHYMRLSDEEREKGVYSFAPFPPDEVGGLAIELYDRHLAKDWREKLRGPELSPQLQEALIQHFKSLDSAPEVPAEEITAFEDVDMLKIERTIRMKRGNFYQVAKDTKAFGG